MADDIAVAGPPNYTGPLDLGEHNGVYTRDLDHAQCDIDTAAVSHLDVQFMCSVNQKAVKSDRGKRQKVFDGWTIKLRCNVVKVDSPQSTFLHEFRLPKTEWAACTD